MRAQKKLLLNQFLDAYLQSKSDNCIRVLHLECGWTVACGDAVLDTVLMRPCGSTVFDTPEQALRVLAGVGVRRAVIEWDGLDALAE